MDASRVHGFFEGLAVAVSLIAIGFVVSKEVDAFKKRNGGQTIRHGMQQWLTGPGPIHNFVPSNRSAHSETTHLTGPAFVSRNNHARSETTELESRVADVVGQGMADMLGQAIIDAQIHSEENQGTDNHGDNHDH